jgi:hypothetical protein
MEPGPLGPEGIASGELFEQSQDFFVGFIARLLAHDGVDTGVGALRLVEGRDVELSQKRAPDQLVIGLGIPCSVGL